ncbi:CDP-alcohol phosphatidyltransferase family protein [Thermostichus vulcanus]|uniref:CDP-alcohol phosphatidyltransferase family protein n=1 Tax=Thermostichus vulcanus str. 'Rupite' TaxID=2813851 RepID=A0ABT0CDI1_THEVL|nr:CDP-alcohol phosphatidyltransferase family protein [Thermostichus vulcanus]MCJ2543777.1 CDP-alcohol phosphatidyltransferase family protein [Thermostichus vulcanus str. 'Rupite']
MLDKVLRQWKERLLAPLLETPLQQVHPLAITLAGFTVGLGSGTAAALGAYGWGLGLWLLNRLMDGLDGTLARLQRRQSDLGGYLDMLLDVVVYAVVPLGLAFHQGSLLGYAFLALMLASFYINLCSWMYLAGLLEKRQKASHDGLRRSADDELTSLRMPAALIEGSETILFYGLFFLLPEHMVALFGLMAILVLLSALQRLIWAVGYLSEGDEVPTPNP